MENGNDESVESINEIMWRARLWRWSAILSIPTLLGLLMFMVFHEQREYTQQQSDPAIVTAWIVGVSYGKSPRLIQNSPIQNIFDRVGLHLSSSTPPINSLYQGTRGSLQLWLKDKSLLPGHPKLICHRVGETAFVDNFGQCYQGFLDLHPGVIGVFLPGYDHSASSMTCILHWQPVTTYSHNPVSKPMRFTVDLTPPKRVLPVASVVPDAVTLNRDGITLSAEDVQLSNPTYGSYLEGQRQLTFEIRVDGGVPWAKNLAPSIMESRSGTASDDMPSLKAKIFDPYGFPMTIPHTFIRPMKAFDGRTIINVNGYEVWESEINGGGRSTDVVRLHIPVRNSISKDVVWFNPVLKVGHILKL